MNALKTGCSMAALIAAACGTSAMACTMNPPEPPPTVWTSFTVLPNGDFKVTIGQKVALFPPTVTTNCACGLGIGSAASPLPGGLMPMGVRVVVVGPNDQIIEELAQFAPLENNGNTSAGLAGGAGATPGAQWFGFFGSVNPFNPPSLPPNAMFKMLFDFVVPAPLIGSLVGLPVQFAGGEGNPDGTPSFEGPHATGYFAPRNDTLPPGVPAPGAAGIAAITGLALLRRRR